jgi:serine protease
MLLAWLPMSLPAADTTGAGVDRIIVKWRQSSADMETQRAHMRQFAANLGNPFASGRHLGGRMTLLQLAVPQQGRQLEDTLAALRADPAVEIAQVDRHVRALAYTPDDPLFSATLSYAGNAYDYQWYLKGNEPAAIRADAAWDITKGGSSPASSPVVVAIVDTGVRPNHPELTGKLLPGFDFVSCSSYGCAVPNDGDGWDADPQDPGDFITAQDLQSKEFSDPKQQCGGGPNNDQALPSSWHGTRVAGLIGADTDNGVGMAGTGFNVRILPVRALGKCGGYESDVIAGMYWAAGFYDSASGMPIPAPVLADPTALNGHRNLYPAQVINLSLGATGPCDALYATAVSDITRVGVLIVAAAGNEGGAVDQPGDCPGVLAVAGLRHAGTKVGYSNLGPEVGIGAPAGNCGATANPNTDPCLYALNTLTNAGTQDPGNDVYSTPLYQPSYGTSFSSPLAAATAGLMKAANPALTPALLIARIKQSARAFPSTDELGTTQACVLPSAGAVQNSPCLCTTQVCGAGMLDAAGAVQAALRPAVLVSISRSGITYTLDGTASAAATGRSIASYAWTVQTVTGGAAMPTITGASQSTATVAAPVQGSVTVQLRVTDDQGATDTALASLAAVAGSSGSPPPQTAISHGGGGLDAALLALLGALLAARVPRRLTSSKAPGN